MENTGELYISSSFIVIDGKCYRWKDIVMLRRTQLAALESAKATQLALFEALHDDSRPTSERTAADRYQQPTLFENQIS